MGQARIWGGVESGPKALEYLQTHSVRLIILDYNMPAMDGLEVLERLKADLRLSSIPVVIFSAYGEEIEEKGMKAGASGYVQKGSLDWLLLGSLIHKILHREASARGQLNREAEFDTSDAQE